MNRPRWLAAAADRWSSAFRLARDVGKQLHELFGWRGPMTHRCFLTWNAWQEDEWDRPDRTDHYLMQIAAGIERLLALNVGHKVKVMSPEDIKMANLQLVFGPAPDPSVVAADEEQLRVHEMQISKQLAIMRRGGRLLNEVPMPAASGPVEEQPDFSQSEYSPELLAAITAAQQQEE